MSWEDLQTSTKSEWDDEASCRQPRVSLVLYHKHRIQIVPLKNGQAVVIGRGRDADVQLSDAMLSRRHARFEVVPGEVTVEDLHSTNGTEVNGRAIRRARVKMGDRITLGGVAVSIHILRPTAAMPGVVTHEQFLAALEEELQQARRNSTAFCALLSRSTSPVGERARWLQEIRHLLGQNDTMGTQGSDMVELLLPRCTPARLQKLAETIATGLGPEPAALCGIAAYPSAGETSEALLDALRSALQRASGSQPVQWAKRREEPQAGTADSWSDLVATPTMQALYGTIRKIARSAIPVLIFGETGTGKEVVARAIHKESGRRTDRLLCVNCGAIPQSLIESELFGHERGAFTGADRRAKGIFEEAVGGTVLLDEIGELSPAAQAALLRVLETKAITRVGSSHPISVDVRILAATHCDLEAMCEQGTFRLDLLHRLNTMTLRVPPLRERRDEVEVLAAHFLRQANAANRCTVDGISPEVLALLRQHHWPGNVRELRNVIDHAVVVANSGTIAVEHLPERILAGATRQRPPPPDTKESVLGRSAESATETVVREMPVPGFKYHVRQVETALIGEALESCGWNKAEAARQLSIPLRTLKEKVRVYAIERERHNPRSAAEVISSFRKTTARWIGPGSDQEPTEFKDRIRRYEAVLIVDGLRAAEGNKAEAARRLGIPLRTLKEKVRAYGLDTL